MKPPFDITADLDTPVSAFLKLRPFRPRLLLESVEGGERVGRYSFLGFGEMLEVRLDEAGLRIGDDVQPAPHGQAALLAALRGALEQAPRLAPAVDGLPFQGGLVGVAAYDIVREFERLPSHAAARPGEPLAAYLAPRSFLVFDHLSRRVALLHAGSDAERAALRRDVIDALRGRLPMPTPGGRHSTPTASLGREAFLAAVERTQHHIHLGDIFQLVLAARFEAECTLHPFEVYRALRLTNPSPYMYFIDFGDFQLAGSSPEALVRLQGGQAWLRPIAGTRPRGADPATDAAAEADLLADPKEASEHVMLVDLARNDLGRVAAPGSVAVGPYRSIERYSHVMHIVSGVGGRLAPQFDMFDLFAAAFPAGTVSGAPKVRAMELIDEFEPVRRGFYAGTVGYFGHGGAMDQAIAIRTLEFRDGRCAFEAGAGIVADSVPEREHAEILAKGAALRAALALAEEGL